MDLYYYSIIIDDYSRDRGVNHIFRFKLDHLPLCRQTMPLGQFYIGELHHVHSHLSQHLYQMQSNKKKRLQLCSVFRYLGMSLRLISCQGITNNNRSLMTIQISEHWLKWYISIAWWKDFPCVAMKLFVN